MFGLRVQAYELVPRTLKVVPLGFGDPFDRS